MQFSVWRRKISLQMNKFVEIIGNFVWSIILIGKAVKQMKRRRLLKKNSKKLQRHTLFYRMKISDSVTTHSEHMVTVQIWAAIHSTVSTSTSAVVAVLRLTTYAICSVATSVVSAAVVRQDLKHNQEETSRCVSLSPSRISITAWPRLSSTLVTCVVRTVTVVVERPRLVLTVTEVVSWSTHSAQHLASHRHRQFVLIVEDVVSLWRKSVRLVVAADSARRNVR